MSASRMMPPTTHSDVVHAFVVEELHELGQIGVVAPERSERTDESSTSSCTAAEAIISGVWRKPV